MLGLQGRQLAHQAVIFGIRNAGFVVDVVTDVVLFDLMAQRGHALRRLLAACHQENTRNARSPPALRPA